MSTIVPRNAATSLIAAGASAVVLPSLRSVINQVLDARADNLALRQAVIDHEAEHSNVLAPPLAQVGSGSGGSGRGGPNEGTWNRRDLLVKPLRNSNVPNTIPRNLASKIVFDVVNIRGGGNTSTSAIAEANFFFTLSQHPQASSWGALFDQYCIVEASVTWWSAQSLNSSAAPIELHTALDFDNSSNLGSLSALDAYGTAQYGPLVYNKKVTRSVKPCVKPDVSSTASAGATRMWIDMAQNATPHFGIRSIFATSTGTSQPYVMETTVAYAFRNSI